MCPSLQSHDKRPHLDETFWLASFFSLCMWVKKAQKRPELVHFELHTSIERPFAMISRIQLSCAILDVFCYISKGFRFTFPSKYVSEYYRRHKKTRFFLFWNVFSGTERAKRVEPHFTPRLSGAIRKKWSKKLLWRGKRAFEDGRWK